jgi:hypothetical protein
MSQHSSTDQATRETRVRDLILGLVPPSSKYNEFITTKGKHSIATQLNERFSEQTTKMQDEEFMTHQGSEILGVQIESHTKSGNSFRGVLRYVTKSSKPGELEFTIFTNTIHSDYYNVDGERVETGPNKYSKDEASNTLDDQTGVALEAWANFNFLH